MNNKYLKTSTAELMTKLTYLEQEINLKLMKYEEIRKELCTRFPMLEEKEEMFNQKVLVKKKEVKNGFKNR
jgi:hypothetical protein